MEDKKHQGMYQKKKVDNQCVIISQAPHETKLNNLKTQKYFNNNKPLHHQSHTNSTTPNSNSSVYQVNTNNSIAGALDSKIRKNSMVVDKVLLQYAEPRSSTKKLVKIQQKVFLENVETDSDEDLNENIPVYIKNKSLGQVQAKNNDSFNSKITQDKLNTTDIDQIEIKLPEEINLDAFLSIDKLYQELTKNIEINKMELPQNKVAIIKDFFTIINDNGYKIYSSFDCQLSNNVHKVCKEYYIQEIIFMCILFMINNSKKNKDQYLSGIKNCIFYNHQNYLACLLIIITKAKGDILLTNEFSLCQKKIEECRTWLNRTNYKRCITHNNKVTKGIMNNIIMQMRQTQEQFSETQLNIIINSMKSIKKIKIDNVLKDLYDNIILKDLNNNNNVSITNDEIIQPSIPFLHQNISNKKYTLVLDLDETLVHYFEDDDNAYIKIRPGAEDFIEEMAEFYEIIIFTAAMQAYADLAIDGIDQNQKISGKLYRQHTITIGSTNIKDLSKLGRPLEKIIIIDNVSDNYSLQPMNGINIKNFEGDENDEELDILKEDLIKLINDNPNDIRDYLLAINESIKMRYQNDQSQ